MTRDPRAEPKGTSLHRPPRPVAHHHAAGLPQRLGGALDLSDVNGRPIGASDFQKHWTLLFFGYSRCRASCPVAIPKIVRAAGDLRRSGLSARAVFVDIDVPPLGVLRFRRPGAAMQVDQHRSSAHHHGDLDRVAAMRAIAHDYDGRLVVASGTRGQLAYASRAFNVAREHIPPRDGEHGHSINHSSLIYILDPSGHVAGYASHHVPLRSLLDQMQHLARAFSGRAGHS
jgi:cytochrome oxidase Cu insertion factor (SCO1/SenC/PrrC family)